MCKKERNLAKRFSPRKAKRLLKRIDKGKLSFEEAKERGLVPPLITSYWLLKRIVELGVFVS